MGKLLQSRTVNLDIEKQIITGAIVSTSFCRQVQRMYRKGFLEIGFGKEIMGWCLEYLEDYNEAPQKQIRDIFKAEKERLDKDSIDVIRKFLQDLSKNYENESDFNESYLVESTRKYFRKRSLEMLFTKGEGLIRAGKINRAERLLERQKKITAMTSGRINPFDLKIIRNFDIENEENRVFKFNGALGDYLGWFERSWLVSFRAPEKRGKSWLLEEAAFQGLMNKKKVMIFSLEMNDPILLDRIYRRLTALPAEDKKRITFPVFDCVKNQNGKCRKNKRIRNRLQVLDEFGERMEYRPKIKFRPCTYCRTKRRKNYEPTYWFSTIKKVKKMKIKQIEKKAIAFKRMFGDNLRMKSFPAFSANSTDIKAELDDLEYTENFIPDLVIIDYIDILGEENNNLSERGNIDATWKQFKNIAASRFCCVVTADQSNKKSVDRDSLRVTDVTEDKRKNAHVDSSIAINQTEDEREDGVMRIAQLLHRHRQISKKQVLLLQSLTLGQPFLDSEIIVPAPTNKKKNATKVQIN